MPTFTELAWPQRTEHLELRPSLPADAPAIHAYRSRPDVFRYLGHDELDLAGVEVMLADHASRTGPPVLHLSALDASTGRLVGDGTLGLTDAGAAPSRRGEVRLVEAWLGYCITPEETSRGLATELAGALLDIAFGQLGLRRVVANVYTEHVASRRVLEKVGMRREGTFRQKVLASDGRWLDDDAFAMLRTEWEAAGRRRLRPAGE